jgi:hypothetical protein
MVVGVLRHSEPFAKMRRKIILDQSVGEEGKEWNSDMCFEVEKIVDDRLDEYGVPMYKTRWVGYSASDDTWEPIENIASTGHV